MQTLNMELTQDQFEDGFEEEWEVVLNTGGKYVLSKNQAWVIQEAIASGNRGIIMFKTFSISLPYVAEFFRIRRFKVGQILLSEKSTEKAWTEEDRLMAIERVNRIKYNLKSTV